MSDGDARVPAPCNIGLDLRAQQALLQAHAHSRELGAERDRADRLAADQGHTLRIVIAYSASAIVDALLQVAKAIHDGPQER